jgi:hypothetical protein
LKTKNIRLRLNLRIRNYPYETWRERIARADAAMYEQAYWILRAYKEKLADPKDGE